MNWLMFFFHKTALGMSFLTQIISSARIILLPTVTSEITAGSHFSQPPARLPAMLLSRLLTTQDGDPITFFSWMVSGKSHTGLNPANGGMRKLISASFGEKTVLPVGFDVQVHCQAVGTSYRSEAVYDHFFKCLVTIFPNIFRHQRIIFCVPWVGWV